MGRTVRDMTTSDTTVLDGPPPAGTEIETLTGSLERMRRTFAWKCSGLDAEAMRRTLGPGSVTLGGLLKHLALVEDDVFRCKLLGADTPAPPFDAVDFDADPEWEWRTAADDSPEELMALWTSHLDNVSISILLLLNGLSMGTVMGVVQVIVQNAAGSMRLGEAAASVQFSRSIGAAFGTALVGTVLFAFLAVRNPEAARVFAAMVEHLGGGAGPAISAAQRAAMRDDIVGAFRAAFTVIGAFTAAGCLLAYTNPQRRI